MARIGESGPPGLGRIKRTFALAGSGLIALIAAAGISAAAAGSAVAAVAVFPVPGSRVASPQAQIVFRGVPASAVGAITVTGSRSGPHSGRLRADSDGQGASFFPAKAFTPGEHVTVTTHLALLGASTGTFGFTVARPVSVLRYVPGGKPPRHRGDVMRFHSRPDLQPAAIKITRRTATASGDNIFLGPQQGPVHNGPMILGPDGRLVFFKPVPARDDANDVRVQMYAGRPVLTWWQGWLTPFGVGVGTGVIDDQSYRQIATVRAGNGLSADLHEFRITPQGTALITAYFPVVWNATAARGARNQIVLDSVVQEIDIPTGNVLYQWDSLDHVSVSDSVVHPPAKATLPYDYFHINSIDPDADGTLIVSGRNTSTAYKIDHQSGRVIWQLGGKHSTFKLGPGAGFAFQHDVRSRAADDSVITMFDNGGGPPRVHRTSRGLMLRLDVAHKTASVALTRGHSPGLGANFEGNFQLLAGGNTFVGWGQYGTFTEFDASGHVVFDAHFVPPDSNYRIYRLPWSGFPVTLPAVAIAGSGSARRLYVSWNGATTVSGWRVLAGSSSASLTAGAVAPTQGFETALAVPSLPYVAVQALDGAGHVLGTSRTVRTR